MSIKDCTIISKKIRSKKMRQFLNKNGLKTQKQITIIKGKEDG